ncbi:HIT family protein [Niallia circulans]|uniref:HIT family protein n=1 Tax=Niallia circulans TaxID=1397 RepID=UPI000BA56904|nr:HIT family protein [Niallia circulans]PAD88046.1 HIT family protein [Niallia circulans]
MDCIGCKLANKNESVYVVYEDDYVCCFLDHRPFNEGHTLILPKKHFYEVEELDESTSKSIMEASILLSKVIKELYHPDGITICQNGGVFKELTHYHMHIVPRYENQSFSTFYSDDESANIGITEQLKETQEKMVGIINKL